ncbi:MAG: helix-turn-helix transcriptional regulator, partial [Conexivisphaera sp.]
MVHVHPGSDAAAATVVIYVTLTRIRRRPAPAALRDPDDRILDFLRRSGGSATEAEIRRALVIPKTTCWRAIKRLEREGLVRVDRRHQRERAEGIRLPVQVVLLEEG